MYKVLNNNPIGIKKLSKAELGLSKTSHQRHIGLYEPPLQKILKNYSYSSEASLFYDFKLFES